MIKIPSCLVKNYLSCFLGLVLLVFVFSCSSQGDSESTIEKLAAYCIRECVIETADSEICDTECKCATHNLSSEYSKEDFANLVQAITQGKSEDLESLKKLKNSLISCKDNSE